MSAEMMTIHDAAIHRFAQYWKRMVRAGYAFASGAALHGAPPERHWVKESRRAWIWGFYVPLFTLLTTTLFGWWGLFTWVPHFLSQPIAAGRFPQILRRQPS